MVSCKLFVFYHNFKKKKKKSKNFLTKQDFLKLFVTIQIKCLGLKKKKKVLGIKGKQDISTTQCYKWFTPLAKAPKAMLMFGIQHVLAQSVYKPKTAMDRSTQSSLKDVLIYLNDLSKEDRVVRLPFLSKSYKLLFIRQKLLSRK